MSGPQTECSCGGMITALGRAHTAMRIDLAVFSIEAALRAAYKLTDRCYVLIDREEQVATAFIIAKSPHGDVSEAAGAFANELIDQQLREQLERQFGALRTLIAAQAFAEGNLLDTERDNADAYLDPRNIGAPR